MDLSRFSPTDRIRTLSSEIVKLLRKLGEITHIKEQETLDFSKTKPKQNSSFDGLLKIFIKNGYWEWRVYKSITLHTMYLKRK